MNDPQTPGASRLSKAGRAVVNGGAVLVSLGSVAWAADLYREVGLVLYTEQFLSAMLALALPVVFLNVPAVKGRTGPVPWYDILAAISGFAALAYVAAVYPRLANELVYQPLDALIVSAVILGLIIEGLRRSVGKVLVGVILVFIAYALWGHHIPGKLVGRSVETTTVIINLALDPQALLGTPMIIATTVVIAFLLLGQILFASGGSAFFTGIAMALMGGYRGGGAKIAVTASGLFGSISGSAVSNVLSTGVITIPLMRESGYSAESAGAIEAVASTGGQLMPPLMGASAFVMAEFLEIPYADVVLAALVPAVLYYFALFVVADLEAARTGITKIDRGALPAAGKVLRAGWFFPLPFGFLIYALFVLNLRPETAALYSALVLLICAAIFGYEGKRISPSGLLGALRDTGLAAVELILIVAAAGLVIGVLNLSGLSFGLTLSLVQLGGGHLFVLLGAYVRAVFRHDVDDSPAGRHRRLCHRKPDPGRSDAHGICSGEIRLARLCHSVPVRAVADPDPEGGDRRDRARRDDGSGRRVAGIRRRRRLRHTAPQRGHAARVRRLRTGGADAGRGVFGRALGRYCRRRGRGGAHGAGMVCRPVPEHVCRGGIRLPSTASSRFRTFRGPRSRRGSRRGRAVRSRSGRGRARTAIHDRRCRTSPGPG